MEKFNIEAYLEGHLSDEDRIEFEHELGNNKSFAQEVALQKQLRNDLIDISLREKVGAALNEKDFHNKNSFKRYLPWIIYGSLAAIFTLVVFTLLNHKSENETIDNNLEEINQDVPVLPTNQDSTILIKKDLNKKISQPENTNIEVETKQPEQKTRKIIAQDINPNKKQDNSQGELRGSEGLNNSWLENVNDNWKTIPLPEGLFKNQKTRKIQELLNNNSFEKAYVRIQLLERNTPENDTIKWIKSYTLLELKEGSEALNILNSIDKVDSELSSHKKWYQAMGYILVRDINSARNTLKEIETTNPKFYKNQITSWKEFLSKYQ